MIPYNELNPEEKRAIRALKRLEKIWPKSLWLFSAAGTLCVMKCGEDGERAYRRSYDGSDSIDHRMQITDIDIPNDGGDW